MTKILNEGFDHLDLENVLDTTLTVDKYAAKMGSDDEIVTLAFTIKSEQAGEDFVDWLERGYEFILDAQVSEGEVSRGKFLVFAEMNRRTSVPERIIELLDDLETLTGKKLEAWDIEIGDDMIKPDENEIKKRLILSPHVYREQHDEEENIEGELNEMREIAGLPSKSIIKEKDQLLKDFMAKAGL